MNFREFSEILYFWCAGPLLLGAAVWGLKQLSIQKNELKRQAATETARQCDKLNDAVIPLWEKHNDNFARKGIPEYKGIIGKFSTDAEPAAKQWVDANCDAIGCPTDLLNRVEGIATYFIHGICDVETAYKPMAASVIKIVEQFYPCICCKREDDYTAYDPVIELYQTFKAMREKDLIDNRQEQVKEQLESLEQAAATIKIPKKKVIGVTPTSDKQ